MSTRLLIPILLVFLITTAVEFSHAQTKGISFQGVIKDPSNNWVNVTGVTIRARILAPNGCVLRDESYPTQNIVNGYVNLNLGNGTPGGADPGLSFRNVFNNSGSTLTGLTCINTDGTLNGSISSYSPTANDSRKLHISLTVGADNLNAQFNMRSSAFAINSETLNGYADSAFVKTSTNITQSNAEAWFASAAFSQILAGTYNAATATAATSATNVTGTVAIANGGTGATTASGARTNLGLGTLAVMSPSGTADATTYLRGDGTWTAIAAGGGTITAVNAGTGITGGGSSGAVTVSLATAGTAGTYTKVTTDAYGRVTSGTTLSASDIPNIDWSKITSGTPTTLSGYGITDGIQNAGSSATTNITSMQAGTDAAKPAAGTAGRVYLATDTQKIYRDNGTTWDAITSSGGSGTIAGVTAGTGITGGGTSGTVTVGFANIANNSILANTSGSAGAPVATTLSTLLDTVGSAQGSVLYRGAAGWSVLAPGTSGQYLQTQGAAANPQWSTVSVSSFSGSLAGDVSGTQSATSVDKIKGKTVSPAAYSSGQVLRYDGTNWVNATLSSADLSNDSNLLKASNMPANCSASQALTFSSPTGTWVCSNIAGLDAGVITTGTIANARLPASATYWDAATGGINYAGGNVGIGTTAPNVQLHVNNSAANASSYGQYTNGSTGSAANNGFYVGVDATNEYRIHGYGATPIKTFTNGVERMRVDSAGNVGIGTTSPSTMLHVYGGNIRADTTTASTGSSWLSLNNTGDNKGFSLGYISNTNSPYLTFNYDSPIGSGTTKMVLTNAGNVGIGTTAPGSKLEVNGSILVNNGFADGGELALASNGFNNWNIDNLSGNLRMFYGGTEKYRLYNNAGFSLGGSFVGTTPPANGAIIEGNVGIGTTSPSTKLHVNGDVTATSYLYASDRRLKTDIHTLDSSLDKVLNLRGVEFKWKKDNKEEVGFIAQEVEKVDPKLVVEVGAGKSDSFKAVKYGNITAYLVEAIKELYAEITGAKQEVAELRKAVEAQQELIRRNDEINKKLLNRIEKLEKQASAGE